MVPELDYKCGGGDERGYWTTKCPACGRTLKSYSMPPAPIRFMCHTCNRCYPEALTGGRHEEYVSPFHERGYITDLSQKIHTAGNTKFQGMVL